MVQESGLLGRDLGRKWTECIDLHIWVNFLEASWVFYGFGDRLERLWRFGLEIKVENWIKIEVRDAPEASNCKKFIFYDVNNIIKSDH